MNSHLTINIRIKKEIVNAIIMAIAVFLATLLAIAFHSTQIRTENILMIYLICVLIVIMETKEYIWGVISSFICIFTFNFLFTSPVHTFMIDDPNYAISLGIFLIVALIVSQLTIKLQKEILVSREIQNETDNLYKISIGYLNVSGLESVALYGIRSLELLNHTGCIIYTFNSRTQELVPYFNGNILEEDKIPPVAEVMSCVYSGNICGKKMGKYPGSKWNYLPIKANNRILGVLAIMGVDWTIERQEQLSINSVLSQTACALEREFLNIAKEESRLIAEKEKLRNRLLRSISHDIRTPLAGIAGSASLLIESRESIDQESMNSLLTDILNDAVWLSNLVENLLNMTRIQDGRLVIKYENEVVDDLVSEAHSRVKKRLGGRKISITTPEDFLIVPVDGRLMIQVLVNLLDNAVKHTKEDTLIDLSVSKGRNCVIFRVRDNGGGISEDSRNSLFSDFASGDLTIVDGKRGFGLGLSICKAIVDAHGGTITGENNDNGGATFEVVLPQERKEEP